MDSVELQRVSFSALVASEENRDEDQRAEATLKTGISFFELRNFGKCFQVMRDVIEKFPVSTHVNQAYYYIGRGHFQLGHYSRAIAALEKVGTAMDKRDDTIEKVEAGKRFFVRIEDADLSALEPGIDVKVRCESTSGDVEVVNCFSVGRNVRIVLGSISTRLGKPVEGNGYLEVKGNDKVKVTYVDEHTADKQFNRPVLREVTVVGDGVVSITDGAFGETLQGVVLGKTVNVQISDPDRDTSDQPDKLNAIVEVYRRKTEEEIETETLAFTEKASDDSATDADASQEPKIDPYKRIDGTTVVFTEVRAERQVSTLTSNGNDATASPTVDDESPASKQPATEPETTSPSTAAVETPVKDDGSIHSGVFRATVLLAKADEVNEKDNVLQALPGDLVRVVYLDEVNSSDGVTQARSEARCVEGNLGGVRVTRAVISDQELRINTQLKSAAALTNIGNRYKEFGLKKNADAKYQQALKICEEIAGDATRLGGRLLEETYVQLWRIYFEMDRLENAAAMAQRLQREFPNSGFVDDALLQLADVARKQGNLRRAIGIYTRLVAMKNSQLRGEAQFGIAQCYDKMAEDANGPAATRLRDRAFQEYKKVFDSFPDSGRVGEAVSQMANYYYKQKDYSRAVDTFETVLSNYPDAKFLDVILFNYGRCLYRMNRRSEAGRRFSQLIAD